MKIWIINHYAIPPSMGGLVRHYYFSKYLQQKGHEVKIFTSSKIHNTEINMIPDKSPYMEKEVDGIQYTFVRNSNYKGNRLGRIINMLQFPVRVWKTCKKFGKPDVIYTSSPDLLTAFTAVMLGRKLKVPKVAEIRDLWQESIVAYNKISRKNPIIYALSKMEKWIYKNADRLVFTMAGGKKYLKEKGWAKAVGLQKVVQVNNGVDIEEFESFRELYRIADKDLEEKEIFKVVYTGSIRKANHLEILIECAKELKKKESKIKLLIWGEGDYREALMKRCDELGLDNIVFKGRVEKKYIPYIVSRADVNLMHGKITGLLCFGISLNKLFDYLAAGRPIFSDLYTEYDLVAPNGCGITAKQDTAKEIADGLFSMEKLPGDVLRQYGENAKELAKEFDYKKLADKMEQLFLEVCGK